MPTDPMPRDVALALVEHGQPLGRVLVLGDGAATTAAIALAEAGHEPTIGTADAAEAKAIRKELKALSIAIPCSVFGDRLPKAKFDAVLDLGKFSSIAKRTRSEQLERLLHAVPALGTVYLGGWKTDFGLGDVRTASNPEAAAIGKAIPVKSRRKNRAASALVIPVQRRRSHSVRLINPSVRDRTTRASLEASPAAATGQQAIRLDPAPIAALQRCPNWCWAAVLEMICKSQGFAVKQEAFVEKIFGRRPSGGLPCVMSGPMRNIAAAIDGTVGAANGRTIRLTGLLREGVPGGSVVREILDSLSAGRPFLFGFEAHAYLGFGAEWFVRPDGLTQITKIELIDPFSSNRRLTWIAFPAPLPTLQKIHGLMLISAERA